MIWKQLKYLHCFFFFLICLSLLLPGEDFGCPPLFDYDEDLALEKKDDDLRGLGPLIEFSSKKDPARQLKAFRPLISSEESPDSYALDILWPFFVYRENNFEKYWRLFLLYSGRSKLSGEESLGDGEKPHSGLIPLWLYGRDKDDTFYWSVFPFYGEARDFLSYDSMYYVMFPVYLKTKKGDSHGEAYFWPIWNYDESPSFKKFRFFPFYAYHDRPNSFRRASYLWPFFHSAEYYTVKDAGSAWMLWPFYGENRFKNLKSWSVLWPFFSLYRRESEENGAKDGFGFNAPWPIVQYKRNVDIDEKNENRKSYIWPLIGRAESLNSEYQFVFWPFFSSLYTYGEQGKVDWVWILPFYWSKHAHDDKGKEREKYRNFYPFISFLERDDFCEIRIFDLWFQRNMPAVERNWTPLWVLFDYQSKGDTFRHDFLWGILKYYSSPTAGEDFSLFPFYRSRSSFSDGKESHVEIVNTKDENRDLEGEGGGKSDLAPEPKRIGLVRRDYFLGALRSSSYSDGSLVLRLLWLFDVEF
jgi:hypothetical protein